MLYWKYFLITPESNVSGFFILKHMSCHLGFHILKINLFPFTEKNDKTESLLKCMNSVTVDILTLPLITYTGSVKKNDIYEILSEEYAEHLWLV